MPPKVELPEGFERRHSDNKIRCNVCASDWMQPNSLRNHQKGKEHKSNVGSRDAAQKQQQRMASMYTADTGEPSAQLEPTYAAPSPPRPTVDPAHDPLPDFLSIFREHNLEPTEDEISYARALLLQAREQTVQAFEQRYRDRLKDLSSDLMNLALRAEGEGDEHDATVAAIADELREAGVLGNLSSETLQARFENREQVDPVWFPYANKTMFFVDLLDSLPRLRLSDAHMKMILFVLAQCGAKDVPSFYALRKCQELLRKKLAPTTVQHRSVHGNIFYSNDIRDTIAMEFANPQIVPHFHPYPEIEPDGVSEVWEASRWREVPRDLLPPMMVHGNQHFYLDELAQLNDGHLVVPHEWVTVKGAPHGLCRAVVVSETTGLAVIEPETNLVRVPITDFRYTLPELRSQDRVPPLADFGQDNPLRAVADNDELYTVFVNLWADDVSGNVSKQYNKHINIYVSNMGLPAALLQQEYFVRFVSTSPSATGPEQFSAIKEHILATHKNPRQCYHAGNRKTCKFRIVAQALPGDNPQQSENCSHAGGMSTRHCRRCMNVRRPGEDDDSETWFTSNFEPGKPRTAADTLLYVEDQFHIACSGVASAVKTAQTATGVKDSIANVWVAKLIEEARRLQNAGETSPDAIASKLMIWLWDQPGDKFHPLLEWAGLDPHVDTPVEILHTILLGIAKYVWHGLYSSWTDAMQALFVIRLQSTDISGLSIPPFRAAYMMQYKNNLIGKHFKALLQTQIFHLHELTTDKQFALAKAAGALAAHIWFERIYDMEEYLSDLRILISNTLGVAGYWCALVRLVRKP